MPIHERRKYYGHEARVSRDFRTPFSVGPKHAPTNATRYPLAAFSLLDAPASVEAGRPVMTDTSSRRATLPLALVLALAAAGLSAAVATGPDVSRAQGSAAEPLKGEIRLSPGKVRAMGSMLITLDGLNQKFTEFSRKAGGYEYGAKARSKIAKQCASKAYTVQDQKAAGCTGSDTVDQCMDKLYEHCLKVSSNPNGRDVSTLEFQEWAKRAAAEARALSRMLNQYADQADQTAKTLVP